MWGYIIVCQKEMSAKSLRKLLVKLTSAIKYLRYCSEMNFFLLVFQKLRVAMLTQPNSVFFDILQYLLTYPNQKGRTLDVFDAQDMLMEF